IFARTRGMGILVSKTLPDLADLEQFSRQVTRFVVASPSEPGARQQYLTTVTALLGEPAAVRLFGREGSVFPRRLGIQHRDVPYALMNGLADGGLIFSHLANSYASAFPDRLRSLSIPGAERFGQDIAIVRTARADHALAAAFERFFMEVAPTAYPD